VLPVSGALLRWQVILPDLLQRNTCMCMLCSPHNAFAMIVSRPLKALKRMLMALLLLGGDFQAPTLFDILHVAFFGRTTNSLCLNCEQEVV